MHVETQHLILSYALGKPIGLIKTQYENEDIQSLSGILENRVLQIESIIDQQYEYIFAEVLKQSEFTGTLIRNEKRKAFMNLICSLDPAGNIINDQLVLQLVGTFALFVSKCEGVSQCLLYNEQVYPIGYRRKKIILQKLLNDDGQSHDQEAAEYEEEEKHGQEANRTDQTERGDPQNSKLLKMQEVYENTIMFD